MIRAVSTWSNALDAHRDGSLGSEDRLQEFAALAKLETAKWNEYSALRSSSAETTRDGIKELLEDTDQNHEADGGLGTSPELAPSHEKGPSGEISAMDHAGAGHEGLESILPAVKVRLAGADPVAEQAAGAPTYDPSIDAGQAPKPQPSLAGDDARASLSPVAARDDERAEDADAAEPPSNAAGIGEPVGQLPGSVTPNSDDQHSTSAEQPGAALNALATTEEESAAYVPRKATQWHELMGQIATDREVQIGGGDISGSSDRQALDLGLNTSEVGAQSTGTMTASDHSDRAVNAARPGADRTGASAVLRGQQAALSPLIRELCSQIEALRAAHPTATAMSPEGMRGRILKHRLSAYFDDEVSSALGLMPKIFLRRISSLFWNS